MRGKRFELVIGASIGLALVFASMAGCGGSARGGPADRKVPVSVVQAQSRAVAVRLQAVGTLRAGRRAELTAETGGLVEAVQFEEADRVSQGDVLARLDDAEAQAAVAAAKATYERRQLEREKLEALSGRNAATERELNDAIAAAEEAKAQLELQKERLENHTVVAPFDGRTGRALLDVGDYARPGEGITRLTSVDPIEVHFPISGRRLTRLQPGQPVRVNVPGSEQVRHGEVRFINDQLDPETRMIRVVAEVPNPDGQLRPGQFVDVSVQVDSRPDAVVLPEHAVSIRGSTPFTYVVREGVAHRRDLALGQRFAGSVEVRSGLDAGSFVVSSDHGKVSDGAKVQASPDTTLPQLGLDFPVPESLPPSVTGQPAQSDRQTEGDAGNDPS